MRVAVFGSGGFVGRALCAELMAQGHDVVPLSTKTGAFSPESGLLLLDDTTIQCDAGIYLAQSPFWRSENLNWDHLWNVNVLSARKALDLVRKGGACRFIYTSTGSVYAPSFEPLTESSTLDRSEPYKLSKIQAEEILLATVESHLAVTIARLFTVVGPGQRDRLLPTLHELVMRDQPIKLQPSSDDDCPTDGLRLSLVDVYDVACCLVELLKVRDCPVVNVAASEPTSIFDIASTIGRQHHKKPIFQRTDPSRNGDLVASTEVLERSVNHRFLHWSRAIERAC